MARLLCILLALSPLACNEVLEDKPRTPTCTKWEYNTVVVSDVVKMDQLGYRGWEAFGFQVINHDPVLLMVLFKKRLDCGSCSHCSSSETTAPPVQSSGPSFFRPRNPLDQSI